MVPIPDAYLHLPFRPDDFKGLSAGWLYEQWEIDQHHVDFHGAIDINLPFGSPIYAAAAGYALATWEEFWLRNEESGELLLLDGKPRTFGSGLVLQMWHGKGRYTQYAHLSAIAYGIPYHNPIEENDNLLPSPALRSPVSEYFRPDVALLIRAANLSDIPVFQVAPIEVCERMIYGRGAGSMNRRHTDRRT